MTATALPDRREVLDLLTTRGTRIAGQVDERMDSLEIAVLIQAVEERYGVVLAPTRELMARLSTVAGAVDALREAMRPGAKETG